MLTLPQSSEVLVVGSALSKWKKAFANVKYCDKITNFNFDKNNFGLIFLHTSALTSKADLNQYLKVLKKSLVPKGSLFFFADNYYSFSKIKSLIKGQTAKKSSGIQAGCKYYQNALKSAGFSFFSNFLSMTELCSLEETVKKNNPLLEIPFYYHPVQKFFHLLGKYHYIHDEYLYICSNYLIETNNLFMIIANQLNAYLQYEQTSLSIERFDLRARGAMILFVKEQLTGKQFIVRVITDPKINDIVKRNHSFIKNLYSEKNLPEDIRSKIPDAIDCFMYRDRNIYIESLIPGILAWKVNCVKREKIIYQQADKFITSLGEKTVHELVANQSFLAGIFEDDVARVRSSSFSSNGFIILFTGLVEKIIAALIGVQISTVVSHGDYGYGNILVDPASGELNGVIDWDTGRRIEFVWIDLLNMELQLVRTREQKGLGCAVKNLWKKIEETGSATLFPSKYEMKFGTGIALLKVFLGVAAVRYIGRAAQYDLIFCDEIKEFEKSLNFLLLQLPYVAIGNILL